VWRKKGDEKRFRVGRNGDNLITHFQCDLCVFRNIQRRDPVEAKPTDDLLLACIRRANLDALWSREKSTVSGNLKNVRKAIEASERVGMRCPYPLLGPMPVDDVIGHRAAIHMLLYSLEAGAYSQDHKQFDTIRKMRSAFSNAWGASARGTLFNISTGKEDRRKDRLTQCPTDSEWFGRFQLGCKKRMGQDVRPQLGLSIGVMKEYMDRLESKWLVSIDDQERDLLCAVGAYSALSYAASLRGNEGFLLDLFGLRQHIAKGKHDLQDPHVTAPLLGRLKGEDGERYHMLLIASETASGLKIRHWLEQLVLMREGQGRFHGPAFCDEEGEMVSMSDYEETFYDILHEIQDQRPDLIGADVDIEQVYGFYRSFRRGATTRAREQGVSETDIDLINRWRKVEIALGMKPSMAIRDHYTEVVQLKSSRLRFSKPL
jgi:hypothetical protein